MLHVAIFNLYYIFNTIRISIVPTNKRILINYTNINKFCILMVFAGHLFKDFDWLLWLFLPQVGVRNSDRTESHNQVQDRHALVKRSTV